MQRRTELAALLGVLGLSAAVLLSFLAVTHLAAGGQSCGTIMWNTDHAKVCDGVLSRQSGMVFGLFFASQILLLASGLVFIHRRPTTRFRAWVAPLCIVTLPLSFLFLGPAAITDTKRSDGDPTTTAQWLYLLGTLFVPVALTAVVAAFGLVRDIRATKGPHQGEGRISTVA